MDTKKIFLLLIMSIFLISMVSAEKLTYSPNDEQVEDMKVNVSETIFFGLIGIDDLGNAELKSHKHTKEVLKVGAGNQVTMYYDFNFKELYENGLGEVTFINMKNGKEVERNYKYVYWTTENYKEDIYECSDITLSNGTVNNVCSVVGSETKTRNVWKDYDTKNIPKGKIRIGIEVESLNGDYIDGIWNIATKQIDKHASWSAGLEVGLLRYWAFDETSGTTAKDNQLVHDITTVNGHQTAGGKVNYSYTVGTGDFADGVFNPYGLNTMTTNFWIKRTGAISNDAKFLQSTLNISTSNGFLMVTELNDGIKIAYYDSTWRQTSGYTLTQDAWYMITLVTDTVAHLGYFYMNGVSIANISIPSFTFWNDDFVLWNSNGILMDNVIFDEFGYWNRSLTISEIVQLYNGGNGLYYPLTPSDLIPSVTLNSPANASSFAYPSVTFNTTVTDDFKVQNVSLYIDGVLDQTNTSGVNGIYIFTKSLTNGVHNWSIKAYDNSSQSNQSETRYLNITIIPPTIQLSNPINDLKTTNPTNTFYAYVYDNFAVENVSFYLDSVLNETNTDGTNATNYTFTKTLSEGDHTWYIEAYDNDTFSSTSTVRTISIDTTHPIISNANNLTDINTLTLPVNSTWNYTAYDLHIDSCYYNSTQSATYQIIPCNSSITNLSWSTGGNKTIQYCANDTFGLETCKTNYIYVYYLTYNQGVNPNPIGEGTNATFYLNVSRYDIPVTTATLNFNGTFYSPATTDVNDNYYYFEKEIEIAQGIGSDLGNPLPYYWNYTVNGILTNSNTTNQNLTVYTIAIDDCSSYGEQIFNFTLRDEELGSLINENSTVEIEVIVYNLDYSKSWSLSQEFTDENNPRVCMPSGLLNDSSYKIDVTLGYSSTDHVWEFWYLEDGDLTINKTYDAQTNEDISLFNLLTADSTSFLFNYFDQDGLAVEDAIVHVYRKYIGEGIFKEVERAKADQNGDTIIHLVEEDVIYYFVISQYGQIIFTSSTYTALCQATPCTIQIEASSTGATFGTNWDLVPNGAYSISSSPLTREVSLSYDLNTTSTVNLTVYKYNNDGSYNAVETVSSTGKTSTITTTIPQVAGNVSFFASVIIDDDFINSEWVDFEGKAQDRFGITLSLFLGALIILTLGLMAVSEGVGTLIFVILGVTVAGFLGLITTKLSTGVNIVLYLILAGGILLWKLTKGRN